MKVYFSHHKTISLAMVFPMCRLPMMLASLFFVAISSPCQAQRMNVTQPNNGMYSQISVSGVVHESSRFMLLDIRGSPTDLSTQDLTVMAEIFKDVYQQQHDIACNNGQSNQNRRLNLIDAEFQPNEIIGYGSDPRIVPASINFSFIVQLDLVCIGCQATGYDLFQSEETLIVNRQNAYQVPFPSSPLFLKPCVPNLQEFFSSYAASTMETDIPGLDMIYSTDMLRLGTNECDGYAEAASVFESDLTIAFYGNTYIPDLDDQLAIVEQIFISTYNELNVLNPLTCDPYSRILSNATAILYDPFANNTTEEEEGIEERRRLRRRQGYNWKFLNVYFGGTCNGCPADTCLTDDVSGYATCTGSRRRWRQRRRLSEGSNNFNTCYCTTGATDPSLPTNEDLLFALEEQFEILRNETNFTLVESIVYLIEVDTPDSCCGWPTNGNLPVDVDGADFRAAVTNYIDTSSSPYGTPINCWDVSSVTDMTSAFDNQGDFNERLGCWDTSSVTTMMTMFFQASRFNGDISSWDTSNVTSMEAVFSLAPSFNPDMLNWNTSKVTTMQYMFWGVSNFNADISAWDTSKVTTMQLMFWTASSFNVDVSSWDTSSVASMESMFDSADSFNVDISAWDTSKVTTMEHMFRSATSFNPVTLAWDTSSVTSMGGMFDSATSFNADISLWDTSNVTIMGGMFRGAISFNSDISAWDTSKVTLMGSMFESADSFNSDISLWDTGRVTVMSQLFYEMSSFNGDVSQWDTSRVTSMSQMFSGATDFNGDLSLWDTSSVTTMYQMFYQASSFTSDLSSWNTSSAASMHSMFYQASSFTSDISAWDTSRVTSMYAMFLSASNFNADLSAWDTRRVTSMNSMFNQASSFNADISAWNTNKVTTMHSMFNGASQFRQDLCPWRLNDDNLDYMFAIDMFGGTNCPNTDDPSPGGVGPWCFTC